LPVKKKALNISVLFSLYLRFIYDIIKV